MLVGLFFNRKIALLFAGSSLIRYQPHPARAGFFPYFILMFDSIPVSDGDANTL